MALGARRGVIVRLVADEIVLVVLVGLSVGVATGYLSGRYIQSQLFGLQAHDPLVFAMTFAALFCAAVGAALIPAVCASRIDPMRALRYE